MSPAADRMAAAEMRAITAYRSIGNKADEILDELEEVTDPNGIVKVEIEKEDSLVIAIEDARKPRRAATAGR